jgi:hypothetical protein
MWEGGSETALAHIFSSLSWKHVKIAAVKRKTFRTGGIGAADFGNGSMDVNVINLLDFSEVI